jgi:hypothetical protein
VLVEAWTISDQLRKNSSETTNINRHSVYLLKQLVNMKTKLKSIAKYFGQIYANYIIDKLSKCENLNEYEQLMYHGVLLDYCIIEYLDIYLD